QILGVFRHETLFHRRSGMSPPTRLACRLPPDKRDRNTRTSSISPSPFNRPRQLWVVRVFNQTPVPHSLQVRYCVGGSGMWSTRCRRIVETGVALHNEPFAR